MITYTPHPSSSSSSCSSFIPMESSSDFPTTNRSSPRQLQGPRPTPLKVRKDSYKINKKPPAVPQNTNHPQQNSQQAPPPPRPPVIIYTVSPKIIHTNPNDFMTLVQRLTGPDSVSSPSAAGSHSPAARFAAIENADKFSPRNNHGHGHVDDDVLMDYSRSEINAPGILSPLPSSLPPISSSFFSPISSFDPGSFGYLLQDPSPGPTGGYFLVSPHNLLNTPTVPSPGSAWDLFNQF